MYVPSELSVCVTSNLLSIKCNGARRYRRNYASNSLGPLQCGFKSSPSNYGLSKHKQAIPSFAVGMCEGGGHLWRCGKPSDTPRRSHLRSDSSRCKMRVIPPVRFIPPKLPVSHSHHRGESAPLK